MVGQPVTVAYQAADASKFATAVPADAGLSSGAKAGIGAGAAIGFVALCALGSLLFWRQLKGKRQREGLAEQEKTMAELHGETTKARELHGKHTGTKDRSEMDAREIRELEGNNTRSPVELEA